MLKRRQQPLVTVGELHKKFKLATCARRSLRAVATLEFSCVLESAATYVRRMIAEEPQPARPSVYKQMVQRITWSWFPQRRKPVTSPPTKMPKTSNERSTPQQTDSASPKWDILALLALLATLLYVDLFVPPHVRPVDLKDPAYNYPHIPDIVSTAVVILGAFFGPIAILLLTQLSRLRSVKFLCAVYVLALFESNVITILLTSLFKSVVGRPRPHFSSVCESYAENVENLCTGHPSAVREARKSFPSGHSSLAFSAATFTFMYLAHALRLGEANIPARLAKMIAALLPLVCAGLIAVSRTMDFHHHFSDVVAGTALGAFVASFVFWCRRMSILKAMEIEQGDENEYIAVNSDEDSV